MNINYIIVLVALVVIGGGVYFYVSNQNTGTASTDDMNGTDHSSMSGMRVEDSAVMVSDQRLGSSISGATIFLAAPGYLVIHADNNGQAGAVLGSSVLLQAGENAGVKVTLTRTTKDGEMLYAMLHNDTDGNGSFDPAKDLPVQSKLGGPIGGMFSVSSDVSENVPVSI